MSLRYPEFELLGDRLRRWIENADEPGCRIPKTTFGISDIDDRTWRVQSYPEFLDHQWDAWAYSMDLPVDVQGIDQDPSYHSQSVLKFTGEPSYWMGRSGPGVVFLDNIRRIVGSTDPYMSEYTKAFYEMHFPLESLKHVVMTTILQVETRHLLADRVYQSSEGLSFSCKEPLTWEPPSPGFCAILGTPIGKVVGAFVLGAYGQGVKRIARIVSFRTGQNLTDFNLRFDIEDV